ncbi:aldo/keto reductase [Micrococcus luteus]
MLTGKYRGGQRPEGGRLVENERYAKRYGLESDRATAERFVAFADDAGIAPAALAVAWAMGHPGVTAPIIGARNLDQLEGSLAALEVEMTPELRHKVSELSPTPPPATDRTETLDGTST